MLADNTGDRGKWANDHILQDGPLDGIHEVGFRGSVPPATEGDG